MNTKIKFTVFAVITLIFFFSLPSTLFNDPIATVITDRNDNLLAAHIASDGQWRFPEIDSLPSRLVTCIRYFEDEYFYWHPGVNPISMVRATRQNIQASKIVSGGSTITMQTIRLSRKNKSRTYLEKLLEVYLAIRLEFSYSKDEILGLYASHAPYGGNIVGVEAASWRYFKRPLDQLSWAEYSTLAVLPNAPGLIHPGRNRKTLETKRNKLLLKLLQNGEIDSTTYSLSLMEKIPDQPHSLPSYAYHLLNYGMKSGFEGQRINTTIVGELQKLVSKKLNRYISFLVQNEVRNACALVISLKDGEIAAYVGNSSAKESNAKFVDLIHAPRSSGSILKPFLYGASVSDGLIHTRTLIKDVPLTIGKFSPHNFNKQFEGMVPAGEALSRSLNVPATILLRDYGVHPFYNNLKNLGFKTINRSVNNYGLSLILGGAEVSLWDLAHAYAYQAINLKQASSGNNRVNEIQIWKDREANESQVKLIDPGAWWLISEALTNVKRPGLNKNWKQYSSTRKIAWKTGTSHGFRDAWAIGYDQNYLVAVWVGNAEGEGRPGLTGISASAPLMFEVFQSLPKGSWYDKPEGHLKFEKLCVTTGLNPTVRCPKVMVEIPLKTNELNSCKYHNPILLNPAGERVYRDCWKGDKKDTVWFELDPIAAYYYKMNHQNYRPIPALSPSCDKSIPKSIGIIYPANGAEIIVPKDFDGKFERIQLKATHVISGQQLFWHLNDQYVGSTSDVHELSVQIKPGSYRLTVLDEKGNKAYSNFKVY
ncbi:MAG: penicillin-binding protein 1C [Crocinitomicaceae bacterium]|nr:penicillin-binding protein 1C [Crocinitomicaceae bacterium]|tara:strand:+ start:1049 stop:3340 length:2292 start_codon:yes stop_codon:yes gene_type:complete